MKKYIVPNINVFEFDKEEILTLSVTPTPTPGLNIGGQGGSEGELEWGTSSIHN